MPDPKNIIIYNTPDGKASVSLYAKDGMVWMNQNQIAELFDTSVPNISLYISNILKEKELNTDSVVKEYLTTESDGKKYKVIFYSLEMNDKKILVGTGSVSNLEMEKNVRKIYDNFNTRRKTFEAKEADKQDLEDIEKELKNLKNLEI